MPARLMFWKREREDAAFAEPHKRPGSLSDFILGSQDGIVNVLGVILGAAIGSLAQNVANPVSLIIAVGLAATFAESISMGAVAYTTTLARRDHYLGELAREKKEMDELPHIEREEVRQILEEWDFHGQELEDMTDRIVSKPKAWLELMMAHELKLAPIEEAQPVRSALLVFAAAIIGSIIPLIPFPLMPAFVRGDVPGQILWSIVVSLIVSGITLFLIGWYKAKVTVGRPARSGLQMTFIGVTSAIAGFGIAYLVESIL